MRRGLFVAARTARGATLPLHRAGAGRRFLSTVKDPNVTVQAPPPSAPAAPVAASSNRAGLLPVLLLVGMAITSNFEEIKHEWLGSPVVPIVRLDGMIGQGGLTIKTTEKAIRQAFRTRRAVAVAIIGAFFFGGARHCNKKKRKG